VNPTSILMFKFGTKPNKKVEELAGILPANGNILDLGCGAGGNSIFLAEKGFSVTCVDKDSEVISVIKQNYPNISAINKSIFDFDFPENKYDLILALNVLNFFKLRDIKTIIDNTIKSLRENGLLYMQVFSINDPSYNKFLEIAEKTGEENTFYSKKTQSFNHFFTKGEISELFSQNEILELSEFSIKDNHLPQGKHEHSIIRTLVKK